MQQQNFYICKKLLKKNLPKVAAHMDNLNLDITMYATQWLMTIFTNSFPFSFVTLVWDVFLHEGWKIVFRCYIAIMKHSAPKLLRMDFEQAMMFFRELPGKVDGVIMMQRALAIPLKGREIQR